METQIITNRYVKKLADTAKLVGNTPLIYFDSLSTDKVKIYAKAEWNQLGASVKARAAFNIIKTALDTGQLIGKTLLDASSGNTAIAYASIGARLGIPVSIFLPDNATEKRKMMLRALGAKLTLTPAEEGTDGSQAAVKELYRKEPYNYFYADQYNNDANWQAHYNSTGIEIWKQTRGKITHFVNCLGTTGSFVGNSKRLREYNPNIKTVGFQPADPKYSTAGWKHLETARFVPGIFTDENLDEIMKVDMRKALSMIKHVANHEGYLLGPSGASNLIGATQVAKTIDEGIIVTLLADDISKYDELFSQIESI